MRTTAPELFENLWSIEGYNGLINPTYTNHTLNRECYESLIC
ncbi:hypothetical protein VCRA2119O147_490033 [Vibrio crassostreae]|nr:hypothetical protein VCRA2113O324_120012 [Vibrio crassostreae]CAK1796435.1 hypothetical protein VCRA2118O429_170019 [Vibrio crassostreae]CAK1806716.1 hypothetical protein VCRA2119O431_190020 [Vibrio crassostreae]CAK1817488.1 hypothetical protein VCRA2113O411_180075 [Vibrio crassostreae]CAK1819793.1 hypothetical protein VCRA2113O413_180075 [Vibrio crassostreae]